MPQYLGPVLDNLTSLVWNEAKDRRSSRDMGQNSKLDWADLSYRVLSETSTGVIQTPQVEQEISNNIRQFADYLLQRTPRLENLYIISNMPVMSDSLAELPSDIVSYSLAISHWHCYA